MTKNYKWMSRYIVWCNSLNSCRLFSEWNEVIPWDPKAGKSAVGTKHSCTGEGV